MRSWWGWDKIIKIVDINKFDDTKFFINTDDKLPDDISFKKCCDINYIFYIEDGDKFYPQLFAKEPLFA